MSSICNDMIPTSMMTKQFTTDKANCDYSGAIDRMMDRMMCYCTFDFKWTLVFWGA